MQRTRQVSIGLSVSGRAFFLRSSLEWWSLYSLGRSSPMTVRGMQHPRPIMEQSMLTARSLRACLQLKELANA